MGPRFWLAIQKRGPIAQRLEPPAHNRSVPGSNPGGPTILLFRRVEMFFKLVWRGGEMAEHRA